jgi:Ca2+-binding EF-hand superfamily protein
MAIFRVVKAIQIGEISMEEIDTNHDGRISKKEIYAVFAKQLGSDASVYIRDDLFEAMDKDGSGYITFDELVLWYAHKAAEAEMARKVHDTQITARKNRTRAAPRSKSKVHSKRTQAKEGERKNSQTQAVSRQKKKHTAHKRGLSAKPAERPDAKHCVLHLHYVRACPDCQETKAVFLDFQKSDYDALPLTDNARKFCWRHYVGKNNTSNCFECKIAERSHESAMWSSLQEFDERKQYCPKHFRSPNPTEASAGCSDCKHAQENWSTTQQENILKMNAQQDSYVSQSLHKIMLDYRLNLFELFQKLDYVQTGSLDKAEFGSAFMRVANMAWEAEERAIQQRRDNDPKAETITNTQIRFTKKMVSSMFDRYAGVDKELDYKEWLQHFQLDVPQSGDSKSKKAASRGTQQDVTRLQGLLVQIHKGARGKGALKNLFKRIDADASGSISKAELKEALSDALVQEAKSARAERRPVAHWAKKAGPLPELGVRPGDVDKLFSFVDFTNSGSISMHKFVSALTMSTKIESYTASDSDIGLVAP